MRFANVRELKIDTARVLELSRRAGPVVVTRRGRPVAIIRGITEKDLKERFSDLWERIREAAERAGYGRRDVNRLIAEARSGAR